MLATRVPVCQRGRTAEFNMHNFTRFLTTTARLYTCSGLRPACAVGPLNKIRRRDCKQTNRTDWSHDGTHAPVCLYSHSRTGRNNRFSILFRSPVQSPKTERTRHRQVPEKLFSPIAQAVLSG